MELLVSLQKKSALSEATCLAGLASYLSTNGPLFWPPGFMWHTRPFIPQQRSLGPREWSISSSSHRPPRWPSTRWAVEQAIWIQSAMGKLEERWEIKGSFLAPIARIGIIVINNVWLLYHRPILGESARIKCWQQKGSSSKEANGYYPHASKYYLHTGDIWRRSRIIPKSSILYRCTIIQTKQD